MKDLDTKIFKFNAQPFKGELWAIETINGHTESNHVPVRALEFYYEVSDTACGGGGKARKERPNVLRCEDADGNEIRVHLSRFIRCLESN